MEESTPKQKAMVFTSYGWRDAEDVARKLAEDLSAAGFEVWIDREQIRPDQKFPEVIRRAITQADVVLVLISPHSVRLPGDDDNPDRGASVCLNELLQAHEERKPIVPVVVAPAEPPWLLNIVERVEFWNRQSDETYRAGVTQIARRISLARETGRTIYIAAIERLHPLDFRNEIVRGAGEFSGRRWLFERLEAWANGPSRCLVIEGDAGSGKSATVSELVRRDPGERILAYHFCRSDQASTVQPAEFVRSVAAMVGGRIEGYRAELNRDELRVRLIGDSCVVDPLRTFFTCIVNPLSQLPGGMPTRYIVVDALDEALGARAAAQGSDIPRLITQALPDLPPWLKIVVTMRRDARLRGQFADAEFIRLDPTDPLQRADIAQYLEKRFDKEGASERGRAADTIEQRSAGNFLYARQVANAVAEGELRLDQVDRLPTGLSALFSQTFQARFPDAQSWVKPEQMFGVLLAAKEPLTATQLASITELDLHSDVRPFIEKLTGYVVAAPRQGDESTWTVFHKSLSDWLASPEAGAEAFKVDLEAGRRRVLAWCRRWQETGDRYALLHVVTHLLDAGATQEALLAVRAGLFEKRLSLLGDGRPDLEDAMALASACAQMGDKAAVLELATGGGSWRRNGVAAALQSPTIPDGVVDEIVGRLLALPAQDPLQPTAEVLASRRIALRIAEARRLNSRLLQAAEDKAPAVRVAAATMVYRCWLRQRDEGWRLLEQLAAAMLGPMSTPRGNILEVFGHASLAILNNHQDEPESMQRLLGIWRASVEAIMRSPVVRLLGKKWSLNILLVPLVELMKRQPAYQPFNAQEMGVTFARGEDFRENWRVTLDCLENPQNGLDGLVSTLCRADIPFDVYLMLVCERALVVSGALYPAQTFAILETLFRDGAPWFRQSVLYALFHVLLRAKNVDDAWLDKYGQMTKTFFAETGATLTTAVAHYSFAPHLAWPEVVHNTHRPGSGPWLLPELLQQALASGDPAQIERVFKAIDLVGFAYGRRTLALALISKAKAIGGHAVEDRIVEALANVRFEDEALVDDLLETDEFASLRAAVRAASPSITGEDIPTWIDGFVVQTMLTSEPFRRQVCEAFRRALTARSTRESLMQILIWVVNLLAGRQVAGQAA